MRRSNGNLRKGEQYGTRSETPAAENVGEKEWAINLCLRPGFFSGGAGS